MKDAIDVVNFLKRSLPLPISEAITFHYREEQDYEFPKDDHIIVVSMPANLFVCRDVDNVLNEEWVPDASVYRCVTYKKAAIPRPSPQCMFSKYGIDSIWSKKVGRYFGSLSLKFKPHYLFKIEVFLHGEVMITKSEITSTKM